ncbi:MAG TPA: universal stress protein [Bacillota bacterium]|nr:universal stress protein [Bacillota bacterium]
MYKNILVAYDGSILSRQAIEAAKHQATLHEDAQVHIVSVIEATGPYTNVSISQSIINELRAKFLPQMEKIEEEFEAIDIPITTEIVVAERNKKPGKLLVKYAEEQEIDLIIMGSRGLGNIRKVILGSVSNEVVQKAKCPVLVIKDQK